MKEAVGYLRVSTREQGRSGLGLAAQHNEIEGFALREGFTVRSWHQDVQTGAGRDALLLRPGLATALKEARLARCALIVSRLDRLSRNVHFISGLLEQQVHFIVAALGQDCDHFVLHIYASLAEQERKMISERTKAGLARSKKKFGLQRRHSTAFRRRLQRLAAASLRKLALERAEASRVHIEWALSQPGLRGRPITFNGAADRLNEQQIRAPMGGRWYSTSVCATASRLGLPSPPTTWPHAALRARVRAIWKQHPDFTGRQIIESLGREQLAGYQRVWKILKDCRLAAAKNSPSQCQVGWQIDRRTDARVRISAIWRKYPEFTAKRVIEKLGLPYPVGIRWVRKILKECWRASAKRGPKQWRAGRRVYNSRN